MNNTELEFFKNLNGKIIPRSIYNSIFSRFYTKIKKIEGSRIEIVLCNKKFKKIDTISVYLVD